MVRVKRLRFEPDVAALLVLRAELAELLTAAGWTAAEMADVLLVADEIAANAALHAQTPFEVWCQVTGHVEVAVTDGAPERWPYVRPVGDGRPGGFGLRIVDGLAEEWRVERDGDTKTVRVVLGRGDGSG